MTGFPCCGHCLPPADQGGHGTACGVEGCVGNAPGVLSAEGNWVPVAAEAAGRGQAERICRALLSPADVVELPDEHPNDLEETPTP